jgi:FixJ family two-component response regulator
MVAVLLFLPPCLNKVPPVPLLRIIGTTNMSRAPSKQSADPIVLVIDDDLIACDQITTLLDTIGLQSKAYASASEFLKRDLPNQTSCLISDIRMPGLSGFDLHDHLVKRRINIPIIFVSGFADIPMCVKAMKAGAVEFLAKPFRDEDLLDAVRAALDRDRQRRKHEENLNDLHRRYHSLTEREQQVMSFVVAGLRYKQVAKEVGLAEATVKVHRHTLMKKMGGKSLADLVRMARVLGISHQGEWQTTDHKKESDLLAKLLQRS